MSDPLKNKMFNYEVVPPEGLWKKVASALDEANEFLPLSGKMYDFEVTPPSGSWSKISEAISIEQPTPVKSIRSLVYKLAAAAVILGVVLTGSIYLLNQETKVQTVAGNKDIELPREVKRPDEKPQAETEQTNEPDATNRSVYADNPEEQFRYTMASNRPSAEKSRSLRKVRINEPSLGADEKISVPVRPILNEWGDIIQDPRVIANGDEYISVTGPNGQQTRISAKFIDALQYLNGSNAYSDYADPAYYESESWQRKFQEWRNKIMQTSYIPSSTNFLDIMEFKELIQKDSQQ